MTNINTKHGEQPCTLKETNHESIQLLCFSAFFSFKFLHLYVRLSAQQPFVDRLCFNIERHLLWINTIQPYNVTLLMALSCMTFMSASITHGSRRTLSLSLFAASSFFFSSSLTPPLQETIYRLKADNLTRATSNTFLKNKK